MTKVSRPSNHQANISPATDESALVSGLQNIRAPDDDDDDVGDDSGTMHNSQIITRVGDKSQTSAVFIMLRSQHSQCQPLQQQQQHHRPPPTSHPPYRSADPT